MDIEKIDLEELIKSFKVLEKESFKLYLKDIWNDLSQRNIDKNVTGILSPKGSRVLCARPATMQQKR